MKILFTRKCWDVFRFEGFLRMLSEKAALENKLALNDKKTKINYNYCKMGFM